MLAPLIAGATSGLVASLIRVPTEVVKQRMQSGELTPRSISGTLVYTPHWHAYIGLMQFGDVVVPELFASSLSNPNSLHR